MMPHFTIDKLLTQLERDLRNQAVIERMKRLNRKQRTMVFIRRNFAAITAILGMTIWILFCTILAHAEDANFAERFAGKIPCPDNQPCKVLVLTDQELNILAGKNGILDTAAQGRSLELGQFAVYFKQKLATAPAGEVAKSPENPPTRSQTDITPKPPGESGKAQDKPAGSSEGGKVDQPAK